MPRRAELPEDGRDPHGPEPALKQLGRQPLQGLGALEVLNDRGKGVGVRDTRGQEAKRCGNYL